MSMRTVPRRKFPGYTVDSAKIRPIYRGAREEFLIQFGRYPREDIETLLSDRFAEKNPVTAQEYIDFYREEEMVPEELARWYALNNCERARRSLFVGAMMKDLELQTFAEFGCGLGVDALSIRKQGFTPVWLGDICLLNLAFAAKYWAKHQEEARFVDLAVTDICDLPAADLLYTSDVLEHLHNPEITIKPWLRRYKYVVVYAPFAMRENRHQHTEYKRERFIGFMSLMGYKKLVYNLAFPPMVYVRQDI